MGASIHLTNRPKRKKYNPKAGDLKTVRGVVYVRVARMYNGVRVVSNGRQLYEWVPYGSED